MSNAFLYDSDEEFPDLQDGNYDVFLNSIRLRGLTNTLIGVDQSGYIVAGETPSDIFVEKTVYNAKMSEIDDEQKDQKIRVDNLVPIIENNVSDINSLNTSMTQIQNSIVDIQDEQKSQNDSIETLEQKTSLMTSNGTNMTTLSGSLTVGQNTLTGGTNRCLNFVIGKRVSTPGNYSDNIQVYQTDGETLLFKTGTDNSEKTIATTDYVSSELASVNTAINDLNVKTANVFVNAGNILITGEEPVFENQPRIDVEKDYEELSSNDLITKNQLDIAISQVEADIPSLQNVVMKTGEQIMTGPLIIDSTNVGLSIESLNQRTQFVQAQDDYVVISGTSEARFNQTPFVITENYNRPTSLVTKTFVESNAVMKNSSNPQTINNLLSYIDEQKFDNDNDIVTKSFVNESIANIRQKLWTFCFSTDQGYFPFKRIWGDSVLEINWNTESDSCQLAFLVIPQVSYPVFIQSQLVSRGAAPFVQRNYVSFNSTVNEMFYVNGTAPGSINDRLIDTMCKFYATVYINNCVYEIEVTRLGGTGGNTGQVYMKLLKHYEDENPVLDG